MIGFTFASSVLLAALSLSDAQDGTYSPTPSATYPPTVTEFPTSSTYEPTLTEYPTYFETYDPTITAYPTSIESPTVTLAIAVSDARRQQNAAGTKKLSLKGAAVSRYHLTILYTMYEFLQYTLVFRISHNVLLILADKH